MVCAHCQKRATNRPYCLMEKSSGGKQTPFSFYSRFHLVRLDVNREIRNCCCAAKRKSNAIAYMIDDVGYGISGCVSLLRSFVRHDFKHLAVGLVHCFGSYAREVMDALVHIIVNNAFHAAHTLLLHGQHG